MIIWTKIKYIDMLLYLIKTNYILPVAPLPVLYFISAMIFENFT